jgi:hypothetical protein
MKTYRGRALWLSPWGEIMAPRLPLQPRAGGNVLTLFLEPLVTMKLIPWVPSMGGSLW